MIRFLEVFQTEKHPRWLQVQRQVDREDGTTERELHCFPIETLALRAGEYGLTVTRPLVLLDIVTYEAAAGFYEGDEQDYPFMVTEPSVTAGRIKHLERVVKAKAEHEGRAGRRTLAAQRAVDEQHNAVAADVVRRCDLDPELAELGAQMLLRSIPAAREQYLAAQANRTAQLAGARAVNGDRTSTLTAHLRNRLEQERQG